ncbi:MAG: hypothetical protein EBZ77_08285, partial [Chitinophagia bacterium]|nr:hypothetical protein [Chitinophagia bacterium]
MKNALLIAVCACLSLGVQAQINLVKNPDFEDTVGCTHLYDGVTYAKNWTCLDTLYRSWILPYIYGVPEYQNLCSDYSLGGAPHSAKFYQYPHSGAGMMQVQIMDSSSDTAMVNRDYLQGRLARALDSGHSYAVSYYIVGEEQSVFYCNHVAVYFDDGAIDSTHRTGAIQSQYHPQIDDTTIITDTVNWAKRGGVFTANGSEKFLTIGNFRSMYTTQGITRSGIRPLPSSYYGQAFISWYLFDDVSVI